MHVAAKVAERTFWKVAEAVLTGHSGGEGTAAFYENQSFRASGLSLITAAIVHWNTVYLDRAVQQLRAEGVAGSDDLLAHVAPLGWEHIALTGDDVWSTAGPETGFRPLRVFALCSCLGQLSVRF